jgi:hypothetical protein
MTAGKIERASEIRRPWRSDSFYLLPPVVVIKIVQEKVGVSLYIRATFPVPDFMA